MPAVGGEDGFVEGAVEVVEPGGVLVVELSECALLPRVGPCLQMRTDTVLA